MKCLTYTKLITNLSSLPTTVTIPFYNSQNGLRFGIGILSLILKVRLKVTFESVFTFRLNFQFCDCSCSGSRMHIERWTTTIAAKPIFDFVMWCDVSDHIQKCILNEFSVTIQCSHWKTVQVVHQPETELKSLTSLVTCAKSSQNWNY